MKKVGDLFAELGFNAKGSDEVKIAFIKNLVKSAYGVEMQGPKKDLPQIKPVEKAQLSFNFDPEIKKAN